MDSIVDARLAPTDASYFSDIFIRMMWAVDHKILDIVEVFEDWLIECTDEYKVEIVLCNEEIFPFQADTDFFRAIERVRKKMPETASLCDQMTKARGSTIKP